MRRSRAVISAFLAVLLTGSGAAAQPAGDDARAKARVIGEEGLAFFDQGMYIDALDRFERADALIKAPTLALMAARSLEKLGRLVEASERYFSVTRMNLDPKASEVWRQAVVTAGKERDALLPRIPTIEITLEGPGAEGASVRIDGRPAPRAIIGVKSPIDPGIHRVEARGTGTAAAERVSLSEGQASRLVLTLKPAAAGSVPDAAKPSGEAPSGVVTGTGLASGATTATAEAPPSMGLGSSKDGALDDQTRAAARSIGEEGLSLYDQGKYVDALDRFERADDLIKAPTLALMAARSLEKLGRLVEASDRYEQVVSRKVDAGATEAFKQAQAAASKEREALVPRIPSVDVSVAGPGAEQVTALMLDGRRVPPEKTGSARPISAKIPVDPGDHRLEAKADTGEAFERFSVAEGASERVVLTLTGSPNKLLLPSGKAAAEKDGDKGAAASGSSAPPTERRGKTQATLGWVSLGVGAAGVAVGAITGGIAAGKHAGFTDPPCNSTLKTCPAEFADDIDTYNTLRPIASVGFIVGGVGLATGAVLLLTLPRGGARYSTSTEASRVTVTPWIGPASAGVRGSF